MKTRLGFVANSSSSSFVIFIKKEEYDRVGKTLTPIEKDILKFLAPTKQKACGMEFVVIGYANGKYSTIENYEPTIKMTEDEEKEFEENGAYEILENLITKFDDKETLTHSEDM